MLDRIIEKNQNDKSLEYIAGSNPQIKTNTKRKKVFLHQYVHFFGSESWIPISIGLIAAQCRSNDKFNSHFEIMDLQYKRTAPEHILERYDDSSILAFSVYIWNMNLSLEVARLAKKRFPESLIIFGGPSAPDGYDEAQEYLNKYPFIDFLVSGEGETTFLDLCLAKLTNLDLNQVPSLSWINNKDFYQTPQRKMERDMDKFASPYLNKTFDNIINGPYKFHAIWETNRGCPFSCGFCYWGDTSRTKIVRVGDERIEKEMDWFAKNKIELLYIADSNFGWVKKDKLVAQGLVERNKKYGYPKKIMLTWAKNPNENCFEVAKILNAADLCYPITISYQSLDEMALKNIKRSNITVERSKELRLKYQSHNIATYTDLLIGIPGETVNSFIDGIEKAISYGEHDQFQIYPIRILPNTDMARKDYIKEHKIKTVLVPLQAKHGELNENDPVQETEDIIVSTSTMSIADWKKMMEMTWFVQSFFCLKSAYFVCLFINLHLDQPILEFAQFFTKRIRDHKKTSLPILLNEIKRLENFLDTFIEGDPHADFSDLDLQQIRWPIEEISFIKLSLQRELFYSELRKIVNEFIISKGLDCEPELLNQVFDYQQSRIINPAGPSKKNLSFDYNLPEFFQSAILLEVSAPLKQKKSKMRVIENYKYKSLQDFAKYHVWYGRQGKAFYYNVRYDDQISDMEDENKSPFLTAIPTINT